MRKISKNIIILLLILLSYIQTQFIWKPQSVPKTVECFSKEKMSHKKLSDFTDELKNLKGVSILSANEIDGMWYIKVKITGNKEEILNKLSCFNRYSISEYIINFNKTENSLIIEMTNREIT